jgi:hypothetical protein
MTAKETTQQLEQGIAIMKKQLTIFLAAIVISFPAYAADGRPHEEKHSPATSVEQLSPGLRLLLAEEMVALQAGMQSLIPAIISGDWEKIAGLGEKIGDSFILAQKLTPSQADELHRSLPLAFLELDQEFHLYAGMLAHAANNRNPELVSFYFYRMNDSCLSCHRKFATHRFPKLKPGAIEKHHH